MLSNFLHPHPTTSPHRHHYPLQQSNNNNPANSKTKNMIDTCHLSNHPPTTQKAISPTKLLVDAAVAAAKGHLLDHHHLLSILAHRPPPRTAARTTGGNRSRADAHSARREGREAEARRVHRAHGPSARRPRKRSTLSTPQCVVCSGEGKLLSRAVTWAKLVTRGRPKASRTVL